MEMLDAHRVGTRLFMCPNKFLYRLDGKKPTEGVQYYRCRVPNCAARAITRNGGAVNYRGIHIHEPEELELEVLRFRTELRRRSECEMGNLYAIYMETEARYPGAALTMGMGYSHIRNSMLRARNLGNPPAPDTLLTVDKAILDPRFHDRFRCTLSPDKKYFYHGVLEADDGSHVILLKSEVVIQFIVERFNLGHEPLLYMDTFKISTRSGETKHMMIIYVCHQSIAFPIVFAIMQRNSPVAFAQVLMELKSIMGYVTYTSVITKQCPHMRAALFQVEPNVRILESWFQYSTAVHDTAETLLFGNDPTLGNLVKMTMCLPFLPSSHTMVGWNIICEHFSQHNNPNIEQFQEYMEANWLCKDVTVYQPEKMFTESIQLFHSSLMQIVGKLPTFWTLYKTLQLMENSHGLTLKRVLLNNEAALAYARQHDHLKKQIELANARLANDGNTELFLLHMARQISSDVAAAVIDEHNYSNSYNDGNDQQIATLYVPAPRKKKRNRKSRAGQSTQSPKKATSNPQSTVDKKVSVVHILQDEYVGNNVEIDQTGGDIVHITRKTVHLKRQKL